MPRTALFPGSFDPVTNGHVDIVRQAARLADRLVLAIGTHPGKAPLFATEERLAMVEETCGALARASGCDFGCITFADLVVAAAQRESATLLIRGLRRFKINSLEPDTAPPSRGYHRCNLRNLWMAFDFSNEQTKITLCPRLNDSTITIHAFWNSMRASSVSASSMMVRLP